MRPAFRKRQIGVTLIEALVAMSILGFGLLGIAGLQTSSATNMYTAYQYAQATTLAQSILEKLRANRTATMAGLYQQDKDAVPIAPSKDCSKASCNPAELSTWDLAIWHSMIADTQAKPYTAIPAGPLAILPSGKISITCQGSCAENSIRLITIYWDNRRNGATGAGCNPGSPTDLSCLRLAYVP